MLNKNQVISEIERLQGLASIVKAYEEIAAGRVQKVRGGVLKNREYMSGVEEVFQWVRLSYQKEAVKHKKVIAKKKNGKTAALVITANSGLYGSIISRTFAMFARDTTEKNYDPVVIGKVGKQMMETGMKGRPFAYFDFPDSGFNNELLKMVIEYINAYTTVIVYHGLFKTVVTQDVVATDITGDKELDPDLLVKSAKMYWIFEPSLDEVLSFFETQIFSSLFTQSVHESQLAKFSSRMAVLDQADENVKKRLGVYMLEKERLKHRMINHKQLATLSSMSLWGT